MYNEATFNANNFRWEEVIVVSPQERDCYAEGEVIINQTLNLPYWNGHRVGTLVRQTGTNPVYVVGEDNMLHWLNITGGEFISFGYNASMIHDVASAGNIGNALTKDHFQQCQRNIVPPSPPPPVPTLKPNGALCSMREQCSSNWCQAIPNGTKYCMDVSKSCAVPGS